MSDAGGRAGWRGAARAAYAKVNLTLNVTGKRPDGYHELESVMHAVTLCDDVTVWLRRLAPAPSLRASPPRGSESARRGTRSNPEPMPTYAPDYSVNLGRKLNIAVSVETGDAYIASQLIPADRSNSACRAVEAFFARRPGFEADVDIRIIKRIPAAAGLGGGSADAAAVLLALNGLSGALACAPPFASSPYDARAGAGPVSALFTPLTDDELLAAALEVGADVPFCLLYGAEPIPAISPTTASNSIRVAFATGVGEKLGPVPRPPPRYAVVLANPRAELPTARIFDMFQMPCAIETDRYTQLARAMIQSGGGHWRRCFNALEYAAVKCCPDIARLKNFLTDAGALCASMSGSGPTVFGLFEDRAAACRAADALRAAGGWAVACELA